MAKTKKVVKKANSAKKTVVTKKVQKKTIATNSKKKAVAQKKTVKPKAVVKSKAITKSKDKTAPAKKAPVKKAPIKKVIAKKASVKKTVPAKKVITVKKPAVKKVVAKKVVAKKVTAKKIVAKAKTASAKKAIVKKTPVKKSAPAKKVIATKKPAVKKVVAKKTTVKTKPVQKPVVKKKEINPIVKSTKKVKVPEKNTPLKTNNIVSKDRNRYTDEELQEFRKIIIDKLETARKDLEMLTEAFTNTGGNSTDDTSPTFKVLEEGSQVLSKEENSQLAARLNKFIQNLEAALVRIENKTYGICRVTGKLIPKERLRSVPHATLSIEAKEGR